MAEASRQYVLRARADAVTETRERILGVAREALFSLPVDEFTLPLVAERAGVTTQTVRNHFDSKEGLFAALADALATDLLEQRRASAPLDEAAAARMLAEEYAAYGHAINRLRAAAERSPAVAAMAARGRSEHRRWLEATFAHRLPRDRAARRRMLAALYVATDVGTWWLLRHELGHSARVTTEVMRDLIHGALTAR